MATLREIQWYNSTRKSKKIIAYGYLVEREKDFQPATDIPTEPEYLKRFKITYESPFYVAHRKTGNKFLMLDNYPNEREAKKGCLWHLRQTGAGWSK